MDKSDTQVGPPVTTLEDLGRYLQRLRDARRVTQESLSAKTASSITGDKINRSRISEIENARRDRITERELRVYMLALKCTNDHINQIVNALRQCTRTPQKQSPADPASTNSVMPNFYPDGLSSGEDDLTLQEEKHAPGASEGDPKAGGEKKNHLERRPQEEKRTDYLDTSQPQVLRGRWQRYRIALIPAIALVLAGALTAHDAQFFVGQKNVDPPTSSGTTAILLVPNYAVPAWKDTSDFSKNVPASDRAPVQINGKLPTNELKLQRGDVVDTTSRGRRTQQVVRRCCNGEGERREVNPVAVPPTAWDWQSYADFWQPEPMGRQLATDAMR
jgi:transcriptional regulator with XRE-family HTH domain